MYSHSNKPHTIRLLLLVIFASLVTSGNLIKAQNYDFATLTVNPVIPPYTDKLSDYFNVPGKIGGSILIQRQIDSRSYQFYVHVSIINAETNVAIRTKRGFVPSNPRTVNISVAPNTTLIQYSDLQQAMSEQNLEYVGISREQVAREGLPAGQYNIRLDLFLKTDWMNIYEYRSYAYSPPFTIMKSISGGLLEPPQIIHPLDGSEISPKLKQTLQFSWTIPPGAPITTYYKLKIIEVNERTANYHDMLRMGGYPLFFETTISGPPIYLYTAANPSFREDKTYAFVVQALKPIGTAGADFKNEGYSEVATFRFKDSESVIIDRPVVVEKPPIKDIPPVIAESGLKIFIPACDDCRGGTDTYFTNNSATGSTYQLLGNVLNPHLAGASAVTGSTTVNIPSDAVAVNNARNFYLRWEDKSSTFNKLSPKPGEGIVYQIQIRDAANKKLVWEKNVWNSNSYEQTKHGLPFVDKKEYILHINAVKGVAAQRGFEIPKDKKGKPIVIASSCECKFTYMELPDVSNLVEYTVKGKLTYKFEHHPEKYPLNTTTATLTRYVKLLSGIGNPMIPTPNDDRHSIPIKINDDGTFETTLYAYPDNGLIKDSENPDPKAREFFNIELNSPYYRIPLLEKSDGKPLRTLVNLTDRVIDVGEVTFNVWSYTLEVEVSKGYTMQGTSKMDPNYRQHTPPNVSGDIKRFKDRLNNYNNVPFYEGDIGLGTPKSSGRQPHVTTGKVEIKTGKDGKKHTYITYDKLICNFQDDDVYGVIIRQEVEKNGKKDTLYTNEFHRGGFKFRPSSSDWNEAEKKNKTNFMVSRKAVLIDPAPPLSTVKGKLVFADPNINSNQTKPLANTDIALIAVYYIEDNKGNKTIMDYTHLKNEKNNQAVKMEGAGNQQEEAIKEVLDRLDNRNWVLATTKTDGEGNFEFKDFARIDSAFTTTIKEFGHSGAHEFTNLFTANGKLKYTTRVVVNNTKKHFWLNPSANINVQPSSTVDVKTLKAYVNTYRLRIKPKGDSDDNRIDYTGKILVGSKVRIDRAPIYLGEPKENCSVEQKVGENGVEFVVPKHLIKNKPIGSNMQIKDLSNWLQIRVFTSDSVGEHAFKENKILFPKDYYQREHDYEINKSKGSYIVLGPKLCSDTYIEYAEDFRFTEDFKKQSCEIDIRMFPKNPIVSGRLLDAENVMRGVDGKVDLYKKGWYTYGDFKFSGTPFSSRYTSAKEGGYFAFKDLGTTQMVSYVNPDWEEYSKKCGEITDEIMAKYYDGKAHSEEYWDKAKKEREEKIKALGEAPPYKLEREEDSVYKLGVKATGYSLLKARQQKGAKDTTNVQLDADYFPAAGFNLKMGQQMHFPQILMEPNGKVVGYVVNEENRALPSRVRSTRSRETPTKNVAGRETFEVRVPTKQSDNQDSIYIIPNDLNYFSDTIPLKRIAEDFYSKKGFLDLGKIVVKERKHRIRIFVKQYYSRPPIHAENTGLEGITVRLLDIGEKVTDKDGYADFIFKSPEENFQYELIPPDNSEYIGTAGELTNAESKELTTYTVTLRKGAVAKGKVTTEGKPVPNAHIWVMNGSIKRETQTDKNGQYTLNGIKVVATGAKKYSATIHCGAPADDSEFNNLLGKDKETTFTSPEGAGTADFDLDWFDKANIKSLHGFKITVTDVKEESGGNFSLTGTLNLKDVPGKFEKSTSTSQNPAFSDLKVKINNSVKDEKGRPYFEAVGDAFSVGLKLMNVKLKGTEHEYAVCLENDGEEYLKIAKDGVTGGFISSKARIAATSFKFTSANLKFDTEQFFMSDLEKGKAGGKVVSFKSYLDKGKMDAWQKAVESDKEKTYALHDKNGAPLKFTFIGLDAVSPVESSRLSPTGIITVKPDVWFINPLLKDIRKDTIRIMIPEIQITPEKVNDKGATLKQLTVKFEKWNIEAKDCKIDAEKGGISSNNVMIHTGKLDIPVKSLILNKETFSLGEFDVKKIPLGKGIANIDASPVVEVQFGLDKKCGSDLGPHLKLSLVGGSGIAGSIKNLPGFKQALEFQMISLISNGEEIISFAPDSKSIRLYDVVDFYPLTINSYEESFNIDGTIGFGIPRIPNSVSYKLSYTKKGGKLNLDVGSSNVRFTQVGTFESLMNNHENKRDLQIIKDGLVELHGHIHETGHLQPVKVVVYKQRKGPNNYNIWMEREKAKQSIRFGNDPTEPEFIVDKADMKIINNDWDLLRMKLIPSEAYGKNSGFGSQPLYFELGGKLRTDLTVNDQQIDLVGTNIDPETGNQKTQGLTGFKFVYNYKDQELVGDMTLVDQNIAGVKFGGVLKMAVGRPGFYFAAAGTMQTSPFGKINAGFLLGYYDKKIPNHIWDGILQYSARKEVPCGFTGDSFRGFYALGALSVPFFTFDYSFDFGIASGGVSLDVAAEASVFGSFQKGKNELGFSAMVFANANAYLNAVTCTSISASAKATVKGEAALLLNHPYTARLTVCGDIAFGGCLKQGLPTLAGCVPILSVGKSFAFHAGITGEIDLKGQSTEPRITEATIDAGRCKMKSTCQMGVVKDDPCSDWKEDEEKVKQIEEQQKREQEEQQK